MDRLDAMSILIAIVDAGSLSGASRRLDIPLATVSRKVGDLEAHLKTRLLIRTTRQLSLTDAGVAYVASCRRILEEVGEAERAATGEYAAPRGYLVITAPVVFGRLHVAPVLADFLAHYPQIDARLFLTDRNVQMLEEHVDVAVRVGTLPDSAFVAVSVGNVRLVTCASPDYLTRHGTPATPNELTGHACIAFEGLTSTRTWHFPVDEGEHSVEIRPRLVTNTAECAVDTAAFGVGVTRVLSYQAAAAIREGRLELLLQHYEPAALPVSLVHTGQMPVPIKLRAFLDFARPRLQARLAGL